MSNPYQILGIAPTASLAEIKQKYKKLALKFHPDQNPHGKEKFIEIKKAYDDLIHLKKNPKSIPSSPPNPYQGRNPKYWQHPYSNARPGHWTHTDAPTKTVTEYVLVKETLVLGFWKTLKNNWVDLYIRNDKFPSFLLFSHHTQRELQHIEEHLLYSPGPTVRLLKRTYYTITIKRNPLALKILKLFDLVDRFL